MQFYCEMIYLVEDDDSIRELVLYTLNNAGYAAKGFAVLTQKEKDCRFDTLPAYPKQMLCVEAL